MQQSHPHLRATVSNNNSLISFIETQELKALSGNHATFLKLSDVE